MMIRLKSRAESAEAFRGQHTIECFAFGKVYHSIRRFDLCTYEVDGTFVGKITIGCLGNLAVLPVDRRTYESLRLDDSKLCGIGKICSVRFRENVFVYSTNKRCDFGSSTTPKKQDHQARVSQ